MAQSLNINQTAEFLKNNDNYLVITHKNPDGDTLGSSSALCGILNSMGKTAYLYNNPEITEKFMPYVKEFIAPEGYGYEYVIAVDVAVPDLFCKGFEGDVELCIDHHPTNNGYAKYLCIDADKAACGEIITKISEAMDITLSPQQATLLFIAVTTDTGCFRYSNTNADTFLCGAKLVKAGADKDDVTLKFFRKASRARILLESEIIRNASFYRDGLITVIKISREMLEAVGATENDLDDIANIAGRFEDCIAAITIRETENGDSKVSLRTVRDVNAFEVCTLLGGGGHKRAAGATVKCSIDKAEKLVIEAIEKVWQ